MGTNDATADAAGTGRAEVATVVGAAETVLVVGTAPEAPAEELREHGYAVTVLASAPGWSGELGDRIFDAVVLAAGALDGPTEPTEVLGAAAARVAPGGRVVVVAADAAHAFLVPGARVHDVDHDEVADLRHRLLTMRDHVIGLEAATVTARDAAARAERAAQQQVEEMAASVTWRAGRAAVAPASWVRSRLAGRR